MDVSSIPSISSLSTEEWRRQYERDGRVDLWLEDEFNAGSRLIVSLQPACLGLGKNSHMLQHVSLTYRRYMHERRRLHEVIFIAMSNSRNSWSASIARVTDHQNPESQVSS